MKTEAEIQSKLAELSAKACDPKRIAKRQNDAEGCATRRGNEAHALLARAEKAEAERKDAKLHMEWALDAACQAEAGEEKAEAKLAEVKGFIDTYYKVHSIDEERNIIGAVYRLLKAQELLSTYSFADERNKHFPNKKEVSEHV